MQHLFSIESTTSDTCLLHSSTVSEDPTKWFCPGCGKPDPGAQVPAITLRSRPKDLALNFIAQAWVGVMRCDFFNLLVEERVIGDLIITPVRMSNETEIENFVAFRPKASLVIRGESHSSHRRCDLCDRHIYHPLGKHYVLNPNRPDLTLFGNQFGGLVVPGRIATLVKNREWKHVHIIQLPVLDAPTDGKPLFTFDDDP
jgi:hypothetical protein